MNDFYIAWHWIEKHPYFKDKVFTMSHFQESLLIEVVKVNPLTNSIDKDRSKNTKVAVWLECGSPILDDDGVCNGQTTHDWKLDTGGDTFEEAIINLSKLLKENYGDYDNI